LFLLIGLLVAMAGFAIRLRGPHLAALALLLFVGLSYRRGLIIFFLLVPIILARPFAKRSLFLRSQFAGRQSPQPDAAPDPVLQYLQKKPIAIPAALAVVAVLATVVPRWAGIEPSPAKSITPAAAMDFVRRSNITGNVFNDYNFGGYLIFLNIPTFVDGRALPFGDEFLRRYFEAQLDFASAFRMFDAYNVSWIILQPDRPLTKAIADSASWKKVYSDSEAVVFVRGGRS
jgi:hypothetical protein